MSRISEEIRQLVRERAGDRCEYCLRPNLVTIYGYHVDHVIPIRHGGSSRPENLAWACFECNVTKGRDIASYDPVTGALTPLFNPRTQVWSEHFAYRGPVLVGKTAVGRVTIQVLDLNQIDTLDTRAMLMQAGLWTGDIR